MRYPAFMLAAALLLFSATTTCAQAPASTDTPAALPADVESVDAIIKAVYDVISGPAGPRDWDRFRSLFVPGARLIPTGKRQNGTIGMQVWSPDEYAERAADWFNDAGFFEIETHRTEDHYGHLVHAFSTYESRRNADDEKPFARGINSMQLMHDGTRWWMVSIYWSNETPENPIPDKYLPATHAH